jgi:hypothetical protein
MHASACSYLAQHVLLDRTTECHDNCMYIHMCTHVAPCCALIIFCYVSGDVVQALPCMCLLRTT